MQRLIERIYGLERNSTRIRRKVERELGPLLRDVEREEDDAAFRFFIHHCFASYYARWIRPPLTIPRYFIEVKRVNWPKMSTEQKDIQAVPLE